jgi:hypothetical protein
MSTCSADHRAAIDELETLSLDTNYCFDTRQEASAAAEEANENETFDDSKARQGTYFPHPLLLRFSV